MSTAGTISEVALRPWPREEPSAEDAPSLLFRMVEQRGHLSKITERTLQDEIDAKQDDRNDAMQGIEQEEESLVQDVQERKKELFEARFKMQQFIGSALYEAQVALDFISLLLSKDSPNTAVTTMSKSMRDSKPPLGSLGHSQWPLQEHTQTENNRQALVQKGWRMNGLESAADSILKAATHLEDEVRKETRYWAEVLSISNQGWSVRRLPSRQGSKPTLAVQYGFTEASKYFAKRGLASLLMGEQGNIVLDAELTKRAKTVRVRVSENGKIVGTSKLPLQEDTSDLPIEKLINRAKDSLFEEELYHEVSMETRQLLAYDVKLRDSVIHMPAPKAGASSHSDRTILIDTIFLDEKTLGGADHAADSLAQNVAEALRILLSYEHRQRLRRRSQIPAPLSDQPRVDPSPPLLRPLLTYFLNYQAIASVRGYFNRTQKALASAGLHVAFDFAYSPSLSNLADTIKLPSSGVSSGLDLMVSTFISPLDSKATLILPSTLNKPDAQEEVIVSIRTSLSPPTYGASFKVTLPPSLTSLMFPSKEPKEAFYFKSADDLTSYIDHLLGVDLCHSMLAKDFPGWSGDQRASKLSKSEPKHKKQGQQVLEIQMANGTIKLKTKTMDSKPEQDYTWNGGEEKKSLREVAESFMVSK